MKYGILRQQRPRSSDRDRGYDADLWARLDDLYRGGYQMLEHAGKHLPIHVGEQPERYQERLKLCAYIGYLGGIVDFYAASLFGNRVVVSPTEPIPKAAADVYEEFFRNADLTGRELPAVMKDVVTTSMVKRRGLLGVDFPASGVQVANRRDEEALGLGRPYCFEIPPESVINWEHSDIEMRQLRVGEDIKVEMQVGRFDFVVIREMRLRQAGPFERRPEKPVELFKIWRRDGNRVVWEQYQVPELKKGEKLDEDTDCPMVASGGTSFTEIPVIELVMPDPLWLGNAVGPLNLEHYQRRSALASSQQRSLFEIPVARLGPEIGGVGAEMPAERAQNPNRGDDPAKQFERKGYMVLGRDDSFGFVGPSGAVYSIVEGQLAGLVDEIHRVAHRMAASVSSTSQALARSGASKAADRSDTEIVLLAYGALVGAFVARVVDVISDARGEVDVEWAVHGLDSFELPDRAALVEEALALPGIEAAIRSPTFSIKARQRLALGLLPNAPPDVQDALRKEIEETPAAEESIRVPEIPPEAGGGPPGAPLEGTAPRAPRAIPSRPRRAPVETSEGG